MQPDIATKPEVQELNQAADALVALTTSYAVKTADDYAAAGDDLKRVKAAQKRLDELRRSFTSPLDTAKKAIMDFFRGPESRLVDSEQRIKRAMIAYSDEQDRIRREAQRKLDEEARKERERLAAQAEKAEAAGKTAKAEALHDRAAQVVAPVVAAPQAKVAGVSTREVWRFEITDPAAIPREYLMPDEKKIGVIVRGLKGDTNIPGVRVWSERTLAAGAA